MLEKYWYEWDSPNSDYFNFFPEWLFQYNNELPIVEDIESAYIMWKSEQHRLTPKYDIFHSFVNLIKHYHVTLDDDDKSIKITCQRCYGFLIYSGKSDKYST